MDRGNAVRQSRSAPILIAASTIRYTLSAASREGASGRTETDREKLAITVRHRVLAMIFQHVSAPMKKAALLAVAHYLIRRLSPTTRFLQWRNATRSR